MILVAPFEPFEGRSINRAEQAAAHLRGAQIGEHTVEVTRLPTAFARLDGALRELFSRDPKLLLLVGESKLARCLQVERLAVNVAHARTHDNDGARPIDEEVIAGGELARRVAFDPRTCANAAVAAGVRCEVSSHAGTFCCNAALYRALGLARPEQLVAFVHVPARWPWARAERAARGLYAVAAALVGAR